MRYQRSSQRVALLAAGIGLGLLARRAQRSRSSTDFRGKVVLITGSSRGLGLLMAKEFARQGARIVLCARNERVLEAARREVADLGAEVIAVPCDISKQDQVQRLISEAIAAFGQVDVLVNNAGIITVAPNTFQTVEDFEQAMEVMFWGTVYPTLAVLPQMLARRSGNIVNVTSIGGKVSVPHLLPYNSAKFAAIGFSEGLRAELDRDGIKVTTVIPGLMRTGSYLNAHFKGQNRKEFDWFSLASSLPFLSMDATKAARQIVAAARRGETELTLTLQAKLLARFHGLFPGLTTNILGLVDRFILPGHGNGTLEAMPGKDSTTALSSSFLTTLGQKAAIETNEHLEWA